MEAESASDNNLNKYQNEASVHVQSTMFITQFKQYYILWL